ncbi:MAG: universal stress protein [Alphaproteobacteria bacterium]|nr:universal stress protein [Alphaproteobacteria bacterium]
MFRTILVPVDLAEIEISRKAIEVATSLAQQSGSALRFMTVLQFLPATYLDYIPANYDEKQKAWAQEELDKITARIDLPKERVSSAIRTGGIYPEILAEADQWGADLIVIGSHRPAMSTYLLGSNAKTVVRHAKCSVLVARQ